MIDFWKTEVKFLKEEILFPNSYKGICLGGGVVVVVMVVALLFHPSIPADVPRHCSLVHSALSNAHCLCLEVMKQLQSTSSPLEILVMSQSHSHSS